MALLMSDGFDFYASVADAALQQGSGNFIWDTAISFTLSATTRFSVGQSIQPTSTSNVTMLTKAWGSNDPTFTICFAEFFQTALGSGVSVGFIFSDGATAQCGLWLEADGALRLRAGGTATGAVLAAYTGAFLGTQWNQFQAQVTISSAAGALHVRRNGNTADDFSATGLITQVSANAYANKLSIVSGTSANSGNFRIDDILLFSTTGTTPNTWVGDVRAKQRMSASNPASPLFMPSPATIQIGNTTNGGSTVTYASGTIRFHKITPTKSGSMTKITLALSAAIVGNMKCALYGDNGSGTGPSALLSDTNQIVNPATGANDFTLTTPQNVSEGTVYWMAVWNSVSAVPLSSTSLTASSQTLAYTGTFPNPAVPTAGTTFGGLIYGTYTPFNWSLIDDTTEDGDTTSISDSTVGDQDLYGIQALDTTPSSIICVVAKMFCRKSDSGARSGALQVKSGATTVNGTAAVLSSTGGYLTQQFALDPNTGLAWTETGVDNLTEGPKVTA